MNGRNEIDGLLERAAHASGEARIALRDEIAGYGLDALARIASWTTRDDVPAAQRWFAVRVVTRIAQAYRKEAIEQLRRAATRAPDDATRRDAAAALEALGAGRVVARTPGAPPLVKPKPVTRSGGGAWPGFQEHEFGYVARTCWRSRDGSASLAPLIVTQLRYRDPAFESYAVERRPHLYFALPRRYEVPKEWEQGVRASKLVVYAAGPTKQDPEAASELVAGWYLEKGDGSDGYDASVADLFDLPVFVASLRDDPAFGDELCAVMGRRDLRIGAYTGQLYTEREAFDWIGSVEDGRLVMRERSDGRSELARDCDGLAALLEAAPEAEWRNLHIWTTWPASTAIAGGRQFAFDVLTPVLADLAGLYLHVVDRAVRP